MADDTSKPPDVILAVVIYGLTFVAAFPADRAEPLMDAFERQAGIEPEDRTSALSHCRIRLMACAELRGPGARDRFQEVTASCCLWLALRHHAYGEALSRGLREQVASGRPVVLTATVGHAEGALPGTAWGFMVGERVHDARLELAGRPHSESALVERGEDGVTRETMRSRNEYPDAAARESS